MGGGVQKKGRRGREHVARLETGIETKEWRGEGKRNKGRGRKGVWREGEREDAVSRREGEVKGGEVMQGKRKLFSEAN